MALVGCWAYLFLSTLAIGNIGPFVMIVLPIFLFASVALVAEVHRRATDEPTCDACGKLVVERTALPASVPSPTREQLSHAA